MHWSEPAYILNFRRHGERDAVVSVLTRDAGRFVGLVRGGQSPKNKSGWQEGHLVNAAWRARLPEHLGTLSGEVMRDYSAALLHMPLALSCLRSACALLDATMPERMKLPVLFDAFAELLPLDEGVDDLARYVFFECRVLEAIGYGLDLGSCALTGRTDNLAYVSPKTGRAVSAEAAGIWAPRLLRLPDFLNRPWSFKPTAADVGAWQAVAEGLALTGHFLEHHVFPHLPAYATHGARARRTRLLDLVEKHRQGAASFSTLAG